jgi:hypothetical protein
MYRPCGCFKHHLAWPFLMFHFCSLPPLPPPRRVLRHNYRYVPPRTIKPHDGWSNDGQLYACGQQYNDSHNAGEAAHWPAFQAIAINYLRRRTANFTVLPLSERDAKLTAFIYGLSVHYVVDELWEGLAAPESAHHGFVELTNALNRGRPGVLDAQETVANMAADFYASWVLNETTLAAWTRYFPIDDLVEIYHQTPHPQPGPPGNFSHVTKLMLSECEIIFDLGLWGLKTFGQLLFPLWNRHLYHTPVVQELLLEMPISGVDDLSSLVSFEWGRIAGWMEQGPPPSAQVPPRAQDVIDADADQDARSVNTLFTLLRPHAATLAPVLRHLEPSVVSQYFVPASTAESESTTKTNTFDVVYTGPDDLYAPLTTVLRTLVKHYAGVAMGKSAAMTLELRVVRRKGVDEALPVPAAATAQIQSKSIDAFATFDGHQEVGYLGSATASGDFDADGLPDLVLGAYGRGDKGQSPQAGGVDIHYGSGNTETLTGPGIRSRFGQALTVLDWNHDGIEDLVIGAPGESGWNLTESGNNVPGKTNISDFGPWPWEHSRPVFRGWGRVYVLLGKKGRGLPKDLDFNLTNDNPANDGDMFTLWTQRNFAALGSVLSTGDVDGDGMDDLLLGSPMCPPGDGSLSMSGRIWAVQTSSSPSPRSANVDKAAILSIAGTRHLEWFGQDLAVVPGYNNTAPLLVVGAPYHRHNDSCDRNVNATCVMDGRIYGYALAQKGRTASLQFSISGTVGQSALMGRQMDVNAAADLVAFSSPDDGDKLSGSVTILRASALSKLTGDVRIDVLQAAAKAAVLHGISPYGRFGWTMKFVQIRAGSKEWLVAAAPMYTENWQLSSQRELGAIYAWSGDQLAAWIGGNKTTEWSTTSATWYVVGDRPKARMGTAFSAFVGNGTLVVGSPRASSVEVGSTVGSVDLFALHQQPLQANTAAATINAGSRRSRL